MSFRFSPGTMDSMAGVFAPPKKYRLGSGGGSPKAPTAGGTILGFAVASMFPEPAASGVTSRPSYQAKAAFGGGSQVRMSGRAVMTAERTARRVPEAVVRVTGRQHGGGHVLANFAYISRLGHGDGKEVGLETSEGDVLRDGRDMQQLAKEWHDYEMDGDARRKGATSISMILSMPTGTDPERLKRAALDFAREEFANRSWVASLHTDRDHPHVHLTIARRDHDGRRFHPNRDDLFRYRQRFAEKLRSRGIEANATPARARGIDPRHEPIAAIKMRGRGLVPQLDTSRTQRAQRFQALGKPDPVKAFLAKRQAVVRATYQRSIDELSASPSAADQIVAQSLARFVETMPAPEPNWSRSVAASKAPGRDGQDEPPAGLSVARGTRQLEQRVGEDPMAERLRALRDSLSSPLSNNVVLESRNPGREDPVQSKPTSPLGEDRSQADDSGGSDGRGGRQSRPPGIITDRLRALLDEKIESTKPLDANQANETLRQSEERDRERRERDRPIDRGGPRR